jgi:hypothetical protein
MKDENLIYCEIIEENIRVSLERLRPQIAQLVRLKNLNDDFNDDDLDDFLIQYEKLRIEYDKL